MRSAVDVSPLLRPLPFASEDGNMWLDEMPYLGNLLFHWSRRLPIKYHGFCPEPAFIICVAQYLSSQ
eukprot:6445944-Prorocentrum_lima.AAC.1